MLAAFLHAMLAEHLSFILLLFALYTVAGGILVAGAIRSTPLANTALLVFGTAIASLVGTTGAAMILIRPLIRTNAARPRNTHVFIFFIIPVANVGFLRGVDFFWTAQRMWMQTAIVADCCSLCSFCSTAS